MKKTKAKNSSLMYSGRKRKKVKKKASVKNILCIESIK